MEDNNFSSFTAELAALLAIYDIRSAFSFFCLLFSGET